MYRTRGFGVAPPLAAGYIDCGGGLSVLQGTACPPPSPPVDPALIAQAQSQYDARAARCAVYESKEHMVDTAVAVAVGLLLPGWWKILAIPAWIITDVVYPRSVDCDYGM